MSRSLNIPLLEETLAYVNKHPRTLDQGHWSHRRLIRPNKACFGSRALLLSGARFEYIDGYAVAVRLGSLPPEIASDRGDGFANVFGAARRLLGLTTSEAHMLFVDSRTLREVNRSVGFLLQAHAIVEESARDAERVS